MKSTDATILLADLRGFSAISESHPIGMVFELLNRFFGTMSEVIVRHGGTIDKFMGDSIMGLFGAGEAREDDVGRAVRCAVEMQLAMREVNAGHQRARRPELFMGIGINTGPVMAGRLGSSVHSEHMVIGEGVNLAARIVTFSLRGQVLISEATLRRCGDFVAAGEPMSVYVKGRAEPLTLHEVLGIPAEGRHVPRMEMRKSPRVKVTIPFSYQVVENKIVMPATLGGVVRDMGYHGLLAELEQPLAAHSEIRLDMPLALVSHQAHDIYARVTATREASGAHYAGFEFTSVASETDAKIRHFVQLLVHAGAQR
jgi:adenylate cyclase